MNNEVLKKDLCARLPYGVKVYRGKDTKYKSTLTHNDIDYYKSDLSFLKPCLFPISCLTKEITVNGETFVPIEKMILDHWDGYNVEVIHKTYHNSSVEARVLYKGWDSLEDETEDILRLVTDEEYLFPWWVIEKLNEWHINYRLAPEQFIEATNEYE